MEEEVLATGDPGVVCWNTEVSHPSKMIKVMMMMMMIMIIMIMMMIKAACYQLMRSLTLGVSLHADKMQQSAVTSSTSILRQVSVRSSGAGVIIMSLFRCCSWGVRAPTAPPLSTCCSPRTSTEAGPASASSAQPRSSQTTAGPCAPVNTLL